MPYGRSLPWFLFAFTSSLAAAEPDVFDAVRNNQTDVVRPWLAAKGDPDSRDPSGHPLLILAAYNGSYESLDLLLNHGADPNIQDGMGTALMAAGFKGQTAIVKRLLAAGASVNKRNRIGATALMFAAMTGKFDVVRLLRSHRADVEAQDNRGFTARKLAEQQGNLDMVNVLKRNSGDSKRQHVPENSRR